MFSRCSAAGGDSTRGKDSSVVVHAVAGVDAGRAVASPIYIATTTGMEMQMAIVRAVCTPMA